MLRELGCRRLGKVCRGEGNWVWVVKWRGWRRLRRVGLLVWRIG